MISSPTFNASRSIPGKSYTKNENPASKESSTQHKEDQFHPKCCHDVHLDAQPFRRAPLDPLSPSGLENRSSRGSQSTDSASYHSLAAPSSLPDLRVLHPEQPPSSDSCRTRRTNTSNTPVCSWPPPIPAPGIGRSSHISLARQQAPLHRSDENKSTRSRPFPESTSTWHPSDSSQPGLTTSVTKPIGTTEWKSENVLQPIRPCAGPMPFARRPPDDLWRSDSRPTKAAHGPVDTARSLVCPTPPGLPPRRPELGCSDSIVGLLPHGSLSLSLALGSQPLKASEHTKAVPPIGAERSRVISITSTRIRNPLVTETNSPSSSPWCSSPPLPRLDTKQEHEIALVIATSLEKVQAEPGYASMSKDDLERLLRHAIWNKYAPKIVSPLSPLRTTTPVLDLSADPAYRLRMPSQSNNPSPRYSKCPPRRARTVCDSHQSFNWDTTCMHCQECKRDTVGKRLLAFRYRQHQTQHFQRNKLQAYPARGANASIVNDDRIIFANRIRQVFAYEMDEEEKRLWEDVAAVTGGGSLTFSRVGAPCAAATYRRAVEDGSDDGGRDDYLEIADTGLLANASATLFRDVSVY